MTHNSSLTLTAPDISCDHCRRAIESALSRLDGVSSVEVDVPAKTVQVRYDPAALTPAAIAAALDAEGYPSEES
jgi:copper chaperone CopZ